MNSMCRYIIIIALLVSPAWCAASSWYPVDGPEAAKILVPGERPLTMGHANVFFNCIEFSLGVALSQSEQESVRSALMQEYLQFKGDLLDDMREMRELWNEVSASAADDKGKYRIILKDVLLGEAKKSPGLDISRVISRINDQESDLIAAGTPPVTRRSLASFIELIHLALRLRDRRVVSWDESLQQAIEAALLRRLPSLSPNGRNWLANADIHRALTVRGREEVAADERDVIDNLLIKTFAPAPASGSVLPIDVDAILLPPPNLFQLPTELPWPMR